MPTVDELRAALAVAELEEQLIEAKAAAAAEAEARTAELVAQLAETSDPAVVAELVVGIRAAGQPAPVDYELKAAVREARRAYREMRDAQPPDDGEVRPAVIEAGVTVPTPDEVN